MLLPPGTLVRSPHHYLLAKEDGRLECLRYGDTVWYECDKPMPCWASLEQWRQSEEVSWWQVTFREPAGYYKRAQKELEEGRSWEETIGAAQTAFLADCVEPVVRAYGLKKAADQLPNVHTYGTPGSPATLTAEDLLRRLEPNKSKWYTLLGRFKTTQEQEDYKQLWIRYLRSFPGGQPPPPHLPAMPPTPAEQLAQKIRSCPAASVDPENPRSVLVHHSDTDELIAKALTLSDDMVYATIYLDGGGYSNHYMPLKHFLDLYRD